VETLTFLFTDIEGSTTLLRRVGEGVYGQVLADHHSVIRSALAAHAGKELNTMGDGFFAGFSSPRACVAAALEIQQALEAHPWPAGEYVRVRMGVHTGEATDTSAGLLGLDVHRAARVAAVAHGGQILLSETTVALVRDSLPSGIELKDLGVHRLKDLGRPEQIFQVLAEGLQADFPPLHSLGNPVLQNNLPAQLTSFIGRGKELVEVRSLVESSRLVTLTGPGGCGKTRLSLQVAVDFLDGTGDGVWLVELAAVTDEDAVAPAVSAALGMTLPRREPVLEALLNALAPQHILIVLDNCEHLVGACAKIADTILRRCPRVHLLATSREPLGIGGETIYRVPSLSLPDPEDSSGAAAEHSDAVALFIDRVREQGVEFAVGGRTRPIIASICQRLDGMPLAIELAAARLRSLSVSELSDRLDQRFRLLTGGSRTALERQQTLRATVDWSYALLTAAERALFRRLSVFPEGFDIEAAEAVCGFGDIEVMEVAELLGSLVDKSLVQAEQAGETIRYRLLETIRQFGAERLAEAGDDEAIAVATAHCQHFLAVAERVAHHLTGLDQGQWYARLDVDQANLRRAAEHAAGSQQGTSLVLRFGVALRRYWMARSRNREALDLLEPVLKRPDARTDASLFGAAALTVAICGRWVSTIAARNWAEQAVELARQIDDEALLIESLSMLCANYAFNGEPERGLAYGEESVERAHRLGDDVILSESLVGFLLAEDTIDPARAEHLYSEAIACTDRSGDVLIGGQLHNNAGVHELRAGNLHAARAHLEEAAREELVVGDRSHYVPVNLGWVLRQEGELADARSMFQTALRIGRRNGDESGLGYATMGLACIAADLRDDERAAVLHGKAQAFLDSTEEPWQQPEAGYRAESLGGLRQRLGDDQFDRDYARGMALNFDAAVELAISGDPVRPSPTASAGSDADL
jgi:predicted ATPase/class 3 adenylate cyclase/Tfp pilus assembly protein PilF